MDAPLPENLVQCWEEFLAEPRTLDDLFNHPVLFPLQRRREMEAMHQVARELNPQIVMEIGSDKGGSVWAWVHALPTLKFVIACEIRGTPYSELMEKAFPHIEFLWLPQSSYTRASVDEVSYFLNGWKIDALFIDGDKCHFETDYYLYERFVSQVVFMHDVCDRPMRDAFLRCSRGRKSFEIKDTTEWEAFKNNPPEVLTPFQGWLVYWHGRSCTVGVIRKGA